ncbi:hypothetical protein PV382_23895 [Streptomyces scabiei]|uniref:hypothetical protein n=1 Tax=Streptomyces scabiei TaxID=1930 RepID=UPI0029B5C24C|nr:hypothetical protein [Streptomyces scabiei]MDX3175295.1 hypothetical protein [Streptomyces scabiei]
MALCVWTAAVLAAAVVVCAGVVRYRRLARALVRERATRRVSDACLHRDLAAIQLVAEAERARAGVLREADLVLSAALAAHGRGGRIADSGSGFTDPFMEGGPV